jgi:hypothetical protein
MERLSEINAERSGQMLELRSFSSVDDMVRIRGIAEARLQDIQEQGLACVR